MEDPFKKHKLILDKPATGTQKALLHCKICGSKFAYYGLYITLQQHEDYINKYYANCRRSINAEDQSATGNNASRRKTTTNSGVSK